MITLLSLSCLACRAKWFATIPAYEQRPWCPFCGTALSEVTDVR